jgi:branched-chain amino acid transport system ATP-binding protein
MAQLSVQNICAGFGGVMALDNVSLSVKKGERVGLIGTNGAGKSTLFSVISGYVPAHSGSVHFSGVNITEAGVQQRVKLGLARTFQVPREFGQLSVLENMMAAAPSQQGECLSTLFFRPGAVRRQEEEIEAQARELLSFLNLTKVVDVPASMLSGGQKKLLELGRLLMIKPDFIMLDEPFAGVNPVLVDELSNRIVELNEKGITVLIIEHNLQALSELVPRMYIMDRGKVLCEGTPDHVLSDERVREAYMGGAV